MPKAPSPLLRRIAARSLLAAVVSAAPVLPGCSLFVPPTQKVTLQANDPAAVLYADGREVGTGTAEVKLRRNKSHVFRAETPDGRSANSAVGRSISTTGILDVIGGVFFLVPLLGATSPGFFSLNHDYLYLDVPGGPGVNSRPAAPRATTQR